MGEEIKGRARRYPGSNPAGSSARGLGRDRVLRMLSHVLAENRVHFETFLPAAVFALEQGWVREVRLDVDSEDGGVFVVYKLTTSGYEAVVEYERRNTQNRDGS